MSEIRKTALVLGAGGFIGSHMVNRLKIEGYWVRGVDQKYPEFSDTRADDFVVGNLNDNHLVKKIIDLNEDTFDEIYQFAADMGGAGFIFTGENDANIMHNSCLINLNVLKEQNEINHRLKKNKTKIFYSSSACIYPEYNQTDPDNPDCSEDSAYPAAPDSEYGWEKLFSEHLYLTYNKNFNIPVRVARYHNIYGPEGTWDGGREKAPAAMCRKVGLLKDNQTEIEVWGDGKQTRSFLFIDDCIEATRRLMKSDFIGPINIGSEEMVTINQLVDTAAKVAGKEVTKKYKLDAPLGVRGRNSNNDLVRKKLKWDFSISLEEGMKKTYSWINDQIKKKHNSL
jgi:nucleoside-diphosphate-sugar epimerase